MYKIIFINIDSLKQNQDEQNPIFSVVTPLMIMKGWQSYLVGKHTLKRRPYVYVQDNTVYYRILLIDVNNLTKLKIQNNNKKS